MMQNNTLFTVSNTGSQAGFIQYEGLHDANVMCGGEFERTLKTVLWHYT